MTLKDYTCQATRLQMEIKSKSLLRSPVIPHICNKRKMLAIKLQHQYKRPVGTDRYLVTTHFQPTSARAAFPCWDEPHFKARFKMAVVRQRDFLALSNMPLENTEDVSIFWGSGLVSAYDKKNTLLKAIANCKQTDNL